MSEYDFALQWLNYLGVSVYNKGERVLEYHHDPIYEIKPLGTKIKIGEELGEESDSTTFTSLNYADINNLGFVICSECNPEYFWRKAQRCYYVVRRKRRDTLGLTQENFRKIASRQNMQIQHDANKRKFRVIGENVLADKELSPDAGVGPWIQYSQDTQITSQYGAGMEEMSPEDMRRMLNADMYGEDYVVKEKYIQITEIPLLISDDKYVVCMGREDTPQRMLVTGKSRMGKSTFVNAVLGRVFYKWEERVGWLIDPQNSFPDISMPQDFMGFIRTLELIGEEPYPLPAIHFYLACKHKQLIEHPDISFMLTLDFMEFLNKYDFYSYGMKDWQIPGSKRYMATLFPKIKNCRTKEEMEKVFYENIPKANDEKKGENERSMINKWVSSFNLIFQEAFTSNLYPGEAKATNELVIEFPNKMKMKGHPFIMAMEAGVVPVNNTSIVPNKPWVRNYMADLMQKIRQHQLYLGDKRHRFWIGVDEMQSIYELGKKKDDCSTAFEQLFRQGAFLSIGGLYNTQSLEKMNPELLKNATHLCCVCTQSTKERTMIAKLFNIPPEIMSQAGNLKKQEMMIFSNDPFIIYDRWGRRKVVEDRRWFKGRIIPPVNYHKPPKS